MDITPVRIVTLDPPPPRPDRRIAIFVALAAGGFAALSAFAQDEARVEAWFVHGVGPWLAGLPNLITRGLPFSVAEFVVVGLIIGVLVGLGVLIRGLWRRGWPSVRQVLRTALLGIGVALTVADVFLLVWGLSYARPPVEARWGWDKRPHASIEAEELARLARSLVDEVNERYLLLHLAPDNFVPTAAPRPWPEIDAAVDRGFSALQVAHELHPDLGRSRGLAKRQLFWPVTSWLRIAGFYFPFTAEANVNTGPPEWQQVFTMAHEKAHQRFVASENEANFYGFLACIYSDDPFVQYGGYLFAQRQVLRALENTDPIAFGREIRRRLPGVQRDVNDAYAFWTGFEGPVGNVSRAVNDAYLRANGVAGGVQSYGRSLQLVVRYTRDEAGRWPPAPPPVQEETP
ncbi:MAG: DUF3810 domain-containing protein [Myxococcota bacterium]